MENPESLDVNLGSAEAPAESSPAEETPTTPVETQAPETEGTESAADESASESPEEPRTVPYDRFAQVIKERDALKNQVSAPVQPSVPAAPKYKSFDPAVAPYPTDPLEYADFVAQRSSDAAETRVELKEFSTKYGEFVADPAFVGAVIGLRQDAASKGRKLSFSDAADIAVNQFAAKFRQEGFEAARSGEVAKTSAAVAKSQPKSSTTGGNIKRLSIEDFGKLKPSEQRARYGELLTALSSEE